jgi:hypothetical protein
VAERLAWWERKRAEARGDAEGHETANPDEGSE